MWDQVQIRTSRDPTDSHPDAPAPCLIYLPGLHGDWTLVGSFKAALGSKVRFVEITYPRTTTWTVTDYANGVLQALVEAGIAQGWLLAESFGSQVGWEILRINAAAEKMEASRTLTFLPTGLILAGGFVRHPMPWIIPIVQKVNRAIPIRGLAAICAFYAFYARFRHRRAPETLLGVRDFVRNRIEERDRQAIAYRYTLIHQNDFCQIARTTSVPVYQLTGFFDPVVPWIPVRRWLKRNCASYAGWKLIWRADHNVLGSAPATAAQQVLEWMGGKPT